MHRRAQIEVSGTVQGVAFRHHTHLQAQALGLHGWVRNLPDGRVQILVEGPPDALDSLIAWCRRGPRAAVVRDVQVQHQDATGEFSSFSIRR